MTEDRCLRFHQTPAQLRRSGARGGKACARNRRQRMRTAAVPTPPPLAPAAAPAETVAQAIAILDAQFPWLRGAESRRSADHP
jgi:hypothetical protein